MIKTDYIGGKNNAEWQEEAHTLKWIRRVGEEHLPRFRVIDRPVETITSIKVATDLRSMPPYDAASRAVLRETLGAEMIITGEPRVWVRFLRPRRLSYSQQAVLMCLLGILLVATWSTGAGVQALVLLQGLFLEGFD